MCWWRRKNPTDSLHRRFGSWRELCCTVERSEVQCTKYWSATESVGCHRHLLQQRPTATSHAACSYWKLPSIITIFSVQSLVYHFCPSLSLSLCTSTCDCLSHSGDLSKQMHLSSKCFMFRTFGRSIVSFWAQPPLQNTKGNLVNVVVKYRW